MGGCPDWCPCDASLQPRAGAASSHVGGCGAEPDQEAVALSVAALASPAEGSPHSASVVHRRTNSTCTEVKILQEQVAAARRAMAAGKQGSEAGDCEIWTIAGCAVAVGAAFAVCGGPIDPFSAACVLAALAAIPGCGPCVCNTVGCPDWCPCDASLQPRADAASFHLGGCGAEPDQEENALSVAALASPAEGSPHSARSITFAGQQIFV